jgi:hypothetical protein
LSRNQHDALRKAEAAVLEWHAWAQAHGEKIRSPSGIIPDTEVMRVDYNPAEAGKPEPLFWSEVPPVSRGEIDRTLRLMSYSRDDLLRLCSGLDREALEWMPKSEPRTISNCLRHIAFVEWWYITRLGIELPKKFPSNVFQFLQYTRELASENIERLSDRQFAGVFQPREDPSPICNLWTARKVIRRMVDHERLHYNYIRRIAETLR